MFDLKITFKKNIFAYTIFILSFLVFVFFSSYDSFGVMDLPFPVIILFIALQLVSFFSLNLKFKFKIPNALVSLLCLRAIIFFLGAIINKIDLNSLLYEMAFTLLCIYLVSFTYSFTSESKKEITFVLALFGIITTCQILINILLKGFNKANIVSGIGMSNYAATFILLSFCYFLFYSKKWYMHILTFICLIGVLLTQSFGAYVAVVIMIIIRLFKKYKWNEPNIWILFLVICFLGSIFLLICSKTEIGASIVNKITEKMTLLFEGNFEALGSSRLELYKFTFDNFINNWMFGSINNFNPDLPLNYAYQNSRAHNFILESLIYYGLFGSFVNLAICIYLINFIRKNKLLKTKLNPLIYTIIGALIHGFVEPNFFTMHFEIFFWVLVGSIVSGNNLVEKKEEVTNIKNNVKNLEFIENKFFNNYGREKNISRNNNL